jgi:hypothetical protein
MSSAERASAGSPPGQCGTLADGCGGTQVCGCGTGETCCGGTCIDTGFDF